jgi:glucose-1-phosphate cytidylyltransferase
MTFVQRSEYDYSMKVVILAGGLGTRLREETEFRPKPMVPIAGKPILWHLMSSYSAYGFNDFVICTGYRGEVIREYFSNFENLNLDFTINLGNASKIQRHGDLRESNWTVTVADTGPLTMTGGRIYNIKKYVEGSTFMCTYGDGLSDIDISKLLAFHKSHGKIATISATKPVSRFGSLSLRDDGSVESFKEKPQTDEFVNAGFFVFEPEIFNYLDENCILEQEPLNQLACDSQLMAFKHEGFWQPMDTYRETLMLNEMWESGDAPWKIWQ